MITVYTLPNCVQCNATVRHLNRLGLEYVLKDAQEALTALREAGHTSAPVVYPEGLSGPSWAGYNPDKINALARD